MGPAGAHGPRMGRRALEAHEDHGAHKLTGRIEPVGSVRQYLGPVRSWVSLWAHKADRAHRALRPPLKIWNIKKTF